MENTWEGLLFTDLAKLVSPKPEAKFVMAHCYGDYSVNLPLEVLMDGSSLLAHKHDGKSLSNDHGGPVRLVVPLTVRVEERQVAPRHRVHGGGQARLLGSPGLPQQR